MTLSFLFRMHPDKEIFTSTIIRFKGIKRHQYIFLDSKEPEMAKNFAKGGCTICSCQRCQTLIWLIKVQCSLFPPILFWDKNLPKSSSPVECMAIYQRSTQCCVHSLSWRRRSRPLGVNGCFFSGSDNVLVRWVQYSATLTHVYYM